MPAAEPKKNCAVLNVSLFVAANKSSSIPAPLQKWRGGPTVKQSTPTRKGSRPCPPHRPPQTARTKPSEPRRARIASLRSHKASGARFALAIAAGAALAPVTAAAATAAPTLSNASSHYSFLTLGDPKDPTFNQLLGINDFGEVAGYFGSGSPATVHPNKGYTVAPYSANTFTNENFTASQQTQVTAINDWGNTVGFYVLPSGANYGFLDEDGVLAVGEQPAHDFEAAGRPAARSQQQWSGRWFL